MTRTEESDESPLPLPQPANVTAATSVANTEPIAGHFLAKFITTEILELRCLFE
ncbi:MAG TPA: hypothetical protein VJO99_07385 [Burkholderiaceae bacterium]|nr:hypothetical protein [Burkholderiaceae bacterium]